MRSEGVAERTVTTLTWQKSWMTSIDIFSRGPMAILVQNTGRYRAALMVTSAARLAI
jgi:hypothetical protein